MDDLVGSALEFVKRQRQRLLDACISAGIAKSDLFELTPPGHQFGNWKHKVQIWAGETPVARYFLLFPEVDGKKTIRFVIECGPVVQAALNRIQHDEHQEHNLTSSPRPDNQAI